MRVHKLNHRGKGRGVSAGNHKKGIPKPFLLRIGSHVITWWLEGTAWQAKNRVFRGGWKSQAQETGTLEVNLLSNGGGGDWDDINRMDCNSTEKKKKSFAKWRGLKRVSTSFIPGTGRHDTRGPCCRKKGARN